VPTAYLSPSQLKELTDVSVNPGVGQDGYPLVWNNTTGKWEASNAFTGTLTGSATSLATGRTISATGDVAWTSGAFNGTANVTGTAALATIQGLSPGTYTNANVTVDTKGRVTAVSSGADIDPQVTLPLATNNGGTGTQTGSITGTGELTFASASNGNVTLSPQGTGKTVIDNELDINLRSQNLVETGLNINLLNNQQNANNGLHFRKGSGSFSISNGTTVANSFLPIFQAKNNPSQTNQSTGLAFVSLYPPVNPTTQTLNTPSLGVVNFNARDTDDTATLLPDSLLCFAFWNSYQQLGVLTSPSLLFSILGSGNAGLKGELNIRSTSASTNTTTGALRVAGGAGIAGALHVGGQINGLGAVQSGTPASAAATGTAGQIRWDANYIYVCTATNTWKRVAISTW